MQQQPKFGDANYPTPEESLKLAVKRAIAKEELEAAQKHERDKQAAIANGTWVEPPIPPTHVKEWVMLASVVKNKVHRIVSRDPQVIIASHDMLRNAYPLMFITLFETLIPLGRK